jgi:hypothetical protein
MSLSLVFPQTLKTKSAEAASRRHQLVKKGRINGASLGDFYFEVGEGRAGDLLRDTLRASGAISGKESSASYIQMPHH